MVNIEIAARCLLAMVFAYSAVAKLRNGGAFREFRAWLADLPLPVTRRHAGLAAAAATCAEMLIVVLTVLPWTVLAGFALAAATLGVFIAGACLAITRGTMAACQCFGTRGAPLGWRHVARDIILLAVAVTGAVASDARGARLAGVAVSVAAAAFLAILIVFLDDVLSLFAPGPPDLAGARQRQG